MFTMGVLHRSETPVEAMLRRGAERSIKTGMLNAYLFSASAFSAQGIRITDAIRGHYSSFL
jgi:hypothetical protein